jgi:hypothetical protein
VKQDFTWTHAAGQLIFYSLLSRLRYIQQCQNEKRFGGPLRLLTFTFSCENKSGFHKNPQRGVIEFLFPSRRTVSKSLVD